MPSFRDIFEWETLDQIAVFELYEDCELLKNVGEYTAGDRFAYIYYNVREMYLEFYVFPEDTTPVMKKTFYLEY